MQINLEIHLHGMEGDPIANVICNAVPRVDEWLMLLAGESDPASGRYRVVSVEHVLDPRQIETVQHVCVVVLRAKD